MNTTKRSELSLAELVDRAHARLASIRARDSRRAAERRARERERLIFCTDLARASDRELDRIFDVIAEERRDAERRFDRQRLDHLAAAENFVWRERRRREDERERAFALPAYREVLNEAGDTLVTSRDLRTQWIEKADGTPLRASDLRERLDAAIRTESPCSTLAQRMRPFGPLAFDAA